MSEAPEQPGHLQRKEMLWQQVVGLDFCGNLLVANCVDVKRRSAQLG